MRTLLASVSLLSLCASSLLLVGCETNDCKTEDGKDAVCAESLVAFEGDEQSFSEAYTVGDNVTIQGIYGDIFVTSGDEGEVAVTFMPFNYRGNGQEEDARLELEENLDLAVSAGSDGITVSTGRHDSKNGLGSHITVALPPEFNGVLFVSNDGDGPINQGHIDVSYVAEATTLNVVNHGLENCNILRGDDGEPADVTLLTDTDVRCEADITVRGINDNFVVKSIDPAFHSHVRVEVASVSDQASGGEVTGDNSSIELILPDAGNYNVSAAASGPGAHLGNLDPGSCSETSDEASAELTCGDGGPFYTVDATDGDADDDEDAFVNVLVQ